MKKSLTPLGETEMEVLHHVWDLGEATVADIRERILQKRDIAYTTVMTVMKNLYNKGYLTYRKDGVTYVYSAAIEPNNVQFDLIKRLVNKVFKGSSTALIQTLVKNEKLSDQEWEEIKTLIEQMED